MIIKEEHFIKILKNLINMNTNLLDKVINNTQIITDDIDAYIIIKESDYSSGEFRMLEILIYS